VAGGRLNYELSAYYSDTRHAAQRAGSRGQQRPPPMLEQLTSNVGTVTSGSECPPGERRGSGELIPQLMDQQQGDFVNATDATNIAGDPWTTCRSSRSRRAPIMQSTGQSGSRDTYASTTVIAGSGLLYRTSFPAGDVPQTRTPFHYSSPCGLTWGKATCELY